MELIHLATTKDTMTGIHEVDIRIDGKDYKYAVREFDAAEFEERYRAGKKILGQALAYLKRNQIKPETDHG